MPTGLGDTIRAVVWSADHVALVYLAVLNSAYAVLLALAIPELWKHWRLAADEHLQRLLTTEALPPLSLLVPAHDAETTIGSSLLAFLTLEYPHLEVVVVNDGSTDRTMAILTKEFDLYEMPPAVAIAVPTKPVRAYYRSRLHARLLVIDKVNGGRADALNAAMNAARHPFVVAVDADTVIEPDALLRLARPVLLNPNVAAVGGTVRVANSCTVEFGRVTDARVDPGWLPGCQVVESLRVSLFGRMGLHALGANLTVSGALGLFRKEYLRAIGGYRIGSTTEAMDLAVRLHRWLREKRIDAQLPFVPDAVAWTEVPSTARVWARRLGRSQRGLLTTLWEHKVMLFNPRYGRIGLLAMPYFAFGQLLSPAVEAFGLVSLVVGIAIGAVDGRFALLFLAVAIGYGILLSFWAIALEELSFRRYRRRRDLLRLCGFAIIEGIGYRQLRAVFRLIGLIRLDRGAA